MCTSKFGNCIALFQCPRSSHVHVCVLNCGDFQKEIIKKEQCMQSFSDIQRTLGLKKSIEPHGSPTPGINKKCINP